MSDWQIKPSSGLLSDDRRLVPAATQKNKIIDPDTPVTTRQLSAIVEAVVSKFVTTRPASTMMEHRQGMVAVKSQPKEITIGGDKFLVDAPTLMRMVRQVTQTIGEYKAMDNIYSRYIVPSLRKARSDMISDLERHFRIKWELDNQGNSVFFT